MNRFKLLSIFALIFVFSMFSLEADAQRSRKKRKSRDNDRKETVSTPLKEKIWYGINIGNLGFNNGFSLSTKFTAGYKISDRLGMGVTAKTFFNTFSQPGPDPTFFSYGTGVFTRFKITRDIYAQAEYDFTSYKNIDTTRDFYAYPLIGLGYESNSGGLWSYGLNLLINLNETVRELAFNSFAEYWFSFSYNF